MAGLFAYAAVGAGEGLGAGLIQRALQQREDALQANKDRMRQAERAEDRAWQTQDRAESRGWAIEDRNTSRGWQIEDRDNARATELADRQGVADAIGDQFAPKDAPAPAPKGGPAPAGYGLAGPQDVASRMRRGLIERGMPAHVAEGFVINGIDESGLDPSINEANPTVPGSRGGGGILQWTGPRRVALERYAASRGSVWNDPEMQMDFLMLELETTESGAAKKIMSTRNTSEAAIAIAESYLRPSEENLKRRVGEYARLGDDPGGLKSGGDENPVPRALQDLTGAGADLGTIDRVVDELAPAAKGFRPATPEEARERGYESGQFDLETGRFYGGPAIKDPKGDEPKYRDASPEEARARGYESGQWDENGRFLGGPVLKAPTTEKAPEISASEYQSITKFIETKFPDMASDAMALYEDLRAGGMSRGEAKKALEENAERVPVEPNPPGYNWQRGLFGLTGGAMGVDPNSPPDNQRSIETSPVTGFGDLVPPDPVAAPAATPEPEAPAPDRAATEDAVTTIPADAIEYLKTDPSPEAMAEFDAVFGAGAAEWALSQ